MLSDARKQSILIKLATVYYRGKPLYRHHTKKELLDWEIHKGEVRGKQVVKTAGSRLREMARVVQEGNSWVGYLGDKAVFHAAVKGGYGRQIAKSYMDPEFRGMGLGKKFYGEIARRTPGGVLHSDYTVSPEAYRVWNGLAKSPSLQVSQSAHPDARLPRTLWNGAAAPTAVAPRDSVFKLRMPDRSLVPLDNMPHRWYTYRNPTRAELEVSPSLE